MTKLGPDRALRRLATRQRRRRATQWVGWLSGPLVVLGGLVALAPHASWRALAAAITWASVALPFAGYYVWGLSLHHAGQMPTPRHPWRAELHEGRLVFHTGRESVRLDLSDVVTAVAIDDDSWDQYRAFVSTLVLEVRAVGSISLPLPWDHPARAPLHAALAARGLLQHRIVG
ncbi:MAG: hypothetical protein AB8I08_39625 [Sandaracinaceae bacterium]